VSKLLNKNPAKRLGSGADGADEIMGHPWFSKVDWTLIESRQAESPYKPQLDSAVDVKYFDPEFTNMKLSPASPESDQKCLHTEEAKTQPNSCDKENSVLQAE